MKHKHLITIGLGSLLLGLAGSVLAALPASAATSSCTSEGAFLACTTGSVAAHPYAHVVYVTTSQTPLVHGCGDRTGSWRVFDAANHKTVASGSGGTVRDLPITGLYGSYRASIRGSNNVCEATITLDNAWS